MSIATARALRFHCLADDQRAVRKLHRDGPTVAAHRLHETVDIDQGASPAADHAERDCAGEQPVRFHPNSLHRYGSVKWRIF